MNMELSRRQFMKGAGVGIAGTTLGALGFGDIEAAYAASIRPWKLANLTETRNTCTYCSVACGIIMYSKGDLKKGQKAEIVHIEGDPDHPTNRGTLCPKGAALLDLVHSPNRLLHPEVREPGAKEWKRVSWDEAFNRIAKLMKADRDANFVETNDKGVTVNRWPTTAMLMSSAASNETGYLSIKAARALGMVALDTQARI